MRVADAFCRSRLGGMRELAFGTLPADMAFEPLISRAFDAGHGRASGSR